MTAADAMLFGLVIGLFGGALGGAVLGALAVRRWQTARVVELEALVEALSNRCHGQSEALTRRASRQGEP